MKYNVNDRVVHYGREGVVVDKNPATRKYLVDFSPDGKPNTLELVPVYESELTKIEVDPVT